MIYLITPTGDRFIQFKFCIDFMQNQDYTGDVTWVIVDDSKKHMEIPSIKNWNIIHKKLKYVGGNTQGSNIIAGLAECPPTAKIIMIEDDDFYGPNWLSIISEKLEHCDMAGESHSNYYNIPTATFKHCKNSKHASLCSTGIKNALAYKILLKLCQKRPLFIDIHLWHNFQGQKCLFKDRNVYGIKGLPGRKGIGAGHKPLRHKDDANYSKLRKWIGDDYANKYITLVRNNYEKW